MQDDDLTLEELSARTGVEARTLRSWVSEGLLSPPFKPGRGARYPAGNADRALAVRALKELQGLSLSEIGRRFMMATQEQIREWAQAAGPTLASRGSARDYLARIEARATEAEPTKPAVLFRREVGPSVRAAPAFQKPVLAEPSNRPYGSRRSEQRDTELAGIERLILQLERVMEAPAPRRARGAVWTRISITPDLELSVRGDLEPRERILFEQLADQFRAILMGRARND